VTSHVNHHAPAIFDDELSLWSRCVSMGKVRFKIEYEVWRETDSTLIASGYTEHALLSHSNLRPVRIPDWVRQGIEEFEASERPRAARQATSDVISQMTADRG
jgi:acyl-CoA thioesterase FadM